MALERLTGSLPPPRKASVRQVRDVDGSWLDEALVLWFPGPRSATGEDCAEIHCHGGRAVIRAIERALEDGCGLRRAEAGEFTRRAFLNGRVDLAEAEGLGDLLSAETELQRRGAMQAAGGAVSRRIDEWRSRVLALAAAVEAVIDEINRTGTKIVMTTHSLGQARRLADEVLFIHRGRLVDHAPADGFFAGAQSPEAAAFLRRELIW